MNRRAARRNQHRGKHQKADPAIRRAVERIEAIPSVRRVLLGRREACRHRFPRGAVVYLGDVPGGIRLRGYTDTGVRSIVVMVCSDDGKRAVIDSLQS